MSATGFAVDGRTIGPERPPYIVAELSANHNGSFERAVRILEACAAAGADAVKLQTYTADTITIDSDRPDFLVADGLWKGRRLHELYDQAHTPWDWHEKLFALGRQLGIAVFSTPFDATAVDFLEGLDAPLYKVASFEALDVPLVERIARTGKPIVLSTGMCGLGEIEEAVGTVRRFDPPGFVLLHCISAYPTPVEAMNLRTLPHLAETFGVLAGLSDHTLGTAAAIAATALGAVAIEKHVTLARADGGVDAPFSLEPDELKGLVAATREAHAALGHIGYARPAIETSSMTFRRSLYAVRDIAAGEAFTEENVRSIRPGFGLPPKAMPTVLSSRAARAIARGEPLRWTLLDEG